MTFKEVIKSINHEDDFERASAKLELLNDYMGTEYFMLNGRVTFKNADGYFDLYSTL